MASRVVSIHRLIIAASPTLSMLLPRRLWASISSSEKVASTPQEGRHGRRRRVGIYTLAVFRGHERVVAGVEGRV